MGKYLKTQSSLFNSEFRTVTKISLYKATCQSICPERALSNCDFDKYDYPGKVIKIDYPVISQA